MSFAYPYHADLGNGHYRNPILHADYSDPDVIRVGNDFWMTASSFNCTPGLPILHSLDMINWTLVNYALRQVPHPRYSEVQPGCGVWAPALRHHDGRFWIFFPMPDEGIYVTTATDPLGTWCDPWLLQAAKGWIDPCPFWDDDGQAYLFHAYANSRAGKKERIHCRPMAPDASRLLGEGKELFHTPHHAYLEGPKVHKLNGYYYIMAPGGGVPTGWQVAFRSRDLWGPYEEKIVLERGSTAINGPHQGALVDLPDGSWWFYHFQDTGPFGRIVHLQPVFWRADWPEMGVDHDGNGTGEPVATWPKPALPAAPVVPPTALATTDEFDGSTPTLSLPWQWHANHEATWADLTARPGWLRLAARPAHPTDLGRTPHLLLQKFPARGFTAETLLDLPAQPWGVQAGLILLGGGQTATLAVRTTPQGRHLTYIAAGVTHLDWPVMDGPLQLRVTVTAEAVCTFAYATPGKAWASLPATFTAKEGGWIGAKVGLYATGPTEAAAHADFDYLRFS